MGIKFSSLELVDTRFKILLDESRTYRRPNGNGLKTKTSRRYVVVDEETSALLKTAINTSNEIAKKAGRILSQNDFTTLFFERRSSFYTRLGVNFKRVSEHSGIHASPHKVRLLVYQSNI